jgi:hypothetical protein
LDLGVSFFDDNKVDPWHLKKFFCTLNIYNAQALARPIFEQNDRVSYNPNAWSHNKGNLASYPEVKAIPPPVQQHPD